MANAAIAATTNRRKFIGFKPLLGLESRKNTLTNRPRQKIILSAHRDALESRALPHNMDWWIWTLIGFFFLALEFVTTTMHSAFFAAGAFLVAILVAVHLDLPLWAQLLIFTLFSLITLLILRPLIVAKLNLSKTKYVDTMVGEQAIAMDDIPVAAFGKAEMRGSTWSARNVGETALTRGQRCVVERIEGLVLHLKAG